MAVFLAMDIKNNETNRLHNGEYSKKILNCVSVVPGGTIIGQSGRHE